MERKRDFPQISPSSWEHPADKAALAAFSSLPLAGDLIKRVLGTTTERSLRLAALANAARVTESQFPALHAALREAGTRLDARPLPELYVRLDPAPDARSLGVDRPFIVLSSGALDLWQGEELVCILGHEIGHILSGHAVYKTLLALLIKASATIAGSFPLGGAAISAASAALGEWDRKSELSADRASLLAVQDATILFRTLMKSAGGPSIEQMDINEFFRQAQEYETGEGLLDSFFKLAEVLGASHPFPVIRMTAIQTWERGGSYASILGGDYKRRGAEGERETERDFNAARESYREEFSASEDPLARAAGKVMEALGGLMGASRPTRGSEVEEDEREAGGSGPGSQHSIEDIIDGIFGEKRK